MDNEHILKYESRNQFIGRFWSLIHEKNNKYIWSGDVDKHDKPIFKFNGIIIQVNDFVNVWKRKNIDIKLINKNINYNKKDDIYLNIYHPIELNNNDYNEIIKLYKNNKYTLKDLSKKYNVSIREISNIIPSNKVKNPLQGLL
jgi:hypothetical protein